MDAIWKAWGHHLDAIQNGIIQAVDNNFFDYADDGALCKLEEYFDITYDEPHTLLERRIIIKAFILGSGHIGQKDIINLISAFTDGEIEINLVGGAIRITVTRDNTEEFSLYDCHYFLDKRIPAHLALAFVDKLLPFVIKNKGRFFFIDFAVGVHLAETSNMSLANLHMRAVVKNKNNLSGTILYDNLWYLDGAYSLNGERQLSAQYTQEVL